MGKKRIDYIDVIKTLAFFFVYSSHSGAVGGHLFVFGFYSIATFFFVSGCTERFSKDTDIFSYIKKKCRTLVLPYFVFSTSQIVINLISLDEYSVTPGWVLAVIKGSIRNQFFGGGVWFLTCLFVMSIAFQFIKKLRFSWLIMIVCLCLYAITVLVFPESPYSNPSWIWNVDSAMFYIFYYALGYVSIPYINSLVESDKKIMNIFKAAIVSLAWVYVLLLFSGHNALNIVFRFISPIAWVQYLIENCIVIIVFISAGVFLQNVDILREMGRDSLYLCVNEFAVKKIMTCCITLLGGTLTVSNPFDAAVWAILAMFIGHRLLTPIDKGLLKKLRIL